MKPSIYDIEAVDAEGKNVSLGRYRGRVLLVLNTASL